MEGLERENPPGSEIEGIEVEKSSTREENLPEPQKEGTKRNRGTNISSILVLSVAISILSGMASGWHFSGTNHKEVVVLDVAKIVDAKKKEFIEKYRDRGADPKLKKEMEREISSFTDRLNRVIEEESRGRIVLVRDSVISEAKDITNEVEVKIKGLGDNRAP
jgi:hypothetical protein